MLIAADDVSYFCVVLCVRCLQCTYSAGCQMSAKTVMRSWCMLIKYDNAFCQRSVARQLCSDSLFGFLLFQINSMCSTACRELSEADVSSYSVVCRCSSV